jgi:hypothetical protein
MKKILSLTMVVLLLVLMIPTAIAADTNPAADGTTIKLVGSQESAGESYTVTVPAELQPGQEGWVSARGNWSSKQTLMVSCPNSVTLTYGDQTMTVGTNDIFGLVSSKFGIRGLYFGADQGYIVKKDNADGQTEFTHAFTQAAIEATNKVIEIYAHDSTALTGYVKVEAQMRSNTVLFSPEVLRKASFYAGKQGSSTDPVSIGILPHPKLSSEQAGYKHNVDNHVIYMTIPTTCKDVDRMRNFLEVYAYHSYFTVYKQYLNLYKYQYTTDTDSATMVDEILKSRSFDLAYQYSFAKIDDEYLKGVKAGENVVSTLGSSFGDLIVQAANAYRDKLPGNNK